MCSVCGVSFIPYFFVAMLHRMCPVISFVLPILENLAARCALPALFYLCEVTEDGSVLAGVELELPADDVSVVGQRKFFWSVAWSGCLDAYDQAALEAIGFLQGLYGFVVRDFNYNAMLAYRDSVSSAVTVAATAVRFVARLEREASYVSVPSNTNTISLMPRSVSHVPFDWHLLYSRLVASLSYV